MWRNSSVSLYSSLLGSSLTAWKKKEMACTVNTSVAANDTMHCLKDGCFLVFWEFVVRVCTPSYGSEV